MPEDRTPRKPRSSGGRPGRPQTGGRSSSSSRGGGKEARGGQERRGGGSREFSRPRRDDRPRDDAARSESQARYDGPPIPEEVTGRELDRSVVAQLQSRESEESTP